MIAGGSARRSRKAAEPTTLFTWGYWGWGSAARELVAAATEVETARGFGPPLFVDVRRFRDVRATGFRGNNFEGAAGRGNYVWMPSLGNPFMGPPPTSVRRPITGSTSGQRLRVVDPAAGAELLELVLDAARAQRRVIAFCACEFPVENTCHRVDVAELVRMAAQRQGIGLTTVEWPGGEPEVITLDAPRTIIRSVADGTRTSIPLGRARPSPALTGLPLESPCKLDDIYVLARPACAGARGWSLPVDVLGPITEAAAVRFSRAARGAKGYLEVTSGPVASTAARAKRTRSRAVGSSVGR